MSALPTDRDLASIASLQGSWSDTADRLKSSIEGTRWATFGLSIAGATLAAIASQVDGRARIMLAVVAAAMFASVSFLTARRLQKENAQAWARARSASEALKHLAYAYAARASRFMNDGTRTGELRTAMDAVLKDVDDLLGQRVDGDAGGTPLQGLSAAEYVQTRVQDQTAWYERRANEYQRVARRLRAAEFWLALSTALITAVAGVLHKNALGLGGFDIVALTAVLTTISGAIVAHVEASRYDYFVTSYRAAARMLSELAVRRQSDAQPGSTEWAAFVDACESVIAAETGSWAIKIAM
jgi:hypothetical protein